jgi:hypothetical protein
MGLELTSVIECVPRHPVTCCILIRRWYSYKKQPRLNQVDDQSTLEPISCIKLSAHSRNGLVTIIVERDLNLNEGDSCVLVMGHEEVMGQGENKGAVSLIDGLRIDNTGEELG